MFNYLPLNYSPTFNTWVHTGFNMSIIPKALFYQTVYKLEATASVQTLMMQETRVRMKKLDFLLLQSTCIDFFFSIYLERGKKYFEQLKG